LSVGVFHTHPSLIGVVHPNGRVRAHTHRVPARHVNVNLINFRSRELKTSEKTAMMCQKCRQETFMPFKCQYCGGYFCSQHRLPESHDCPRIGEARVPREEAQPVVVQGQKPIEYTYSWAKQVHRPLSFSIKEVEHLLLATVLVVGVGLSLEFESNGISNDYLLIALFTVAFTASFLMHEMAHKITAQRYGLWAEFRLILMGSVLTAVSIVLPLKFISPGAVMVAGAPDTKTMGKTAVAGPATNIVLATAFLSVAAALPDYAISFGVVAWFNAWIAVINLIPFGIFDGMKVFSWDKAVWALTFAASAALTALLAFMFLA